MKTIRCISCIALSIIVFSVGACTSSNSSSSTTSLYSAKGSLSVFVTDAPPKGITAIEIKASSVEAHFSAASDDQWITVLSDPPVFDLVKAIGTNVLLGTADIAVGKYTQVRLDISDVTVTINGEQVTAIVPSEKLKLVGVITIEEGKTTSISLDFDAEKSIVITGQDKVMLKPVVKLIVGEPDELLETQTTTTQPDA